MDSYWRILLGGEKEARLTIAGQTYRNTDNFLIMTVMFANTGSLIVVFMTFCRNSVLITSLFSTKIGSNVVS